VSKRVKVAELPEFGRADYLASETAIAACLTRHSGGHQCGFAENGAGGHCPCARQVGDRQEGGDQAGSSTQSLTPGERSRIRNREPRLRRTRCAAGCSTYPSGLRWSRDLTTVRHSLRQLHAMRKEGEDEIRPGAPETESLGEAFSKTVRVVMPGGSFHSPPSRQRCGGVIQGPSKGARYTHERRSQGIRRGSETLSAKYRFLAVANFQALQHRADTSLTLGCTCGDGVIQMHTPILNAEEAIWRCSF
jgi:hypothetical protein